MDSAEVKLTGYSKGAGCGCKISPATLHEIIHSDEDFPADPRLLLGNETNDDASVVDIGNGQCLISTTDFFMPVVDDAYAFGKIAAANALSDVYAMGGSPLTALAVLGWPVDKLSPTLAARVVEGAKFICRMAGITLAGGHSIESPEPFFGLSVSGIMEQAHLKRNSTAREGDLLFLTKPLGNGIVTTAQKRGLAREEDLAEAIAFMTSLNKAGSELGKLKGVHAMTDVTGFGLGGHLIEMCEGSGLSAELSFEKIPVYPFLEHYLSQFIYPDMTTKNFSYYSGKIQSLDARQLFTLFDPQTSGGLLIAVEEDSLQQVREVLNSYSQRLQSLEPIGRMVKRGEKMIQLL